MSFQMVPLSAETFTSARLADPTSDERALVHRIVADAPHSYPCRVTLRDADVGDELMLLNYRHQSAASPYRASGPIFVRVNQPTARPARGEVPQMLRARLLSVRGYSERGWIEYADVTDGKDLEAAIERAFASPDVAYLHLHFARPGCYACRVDRVAAQ